MKRILAFLLMLLCVTIVALAQCPIPPGGGNNNPPPPPDHPQDPLDGTSTSGGQSVDPNEIIGPTGYDSVRWVSINDVLNYTIFFENDPDFATANAQKVDVRFSFADKAAMKGFGLGTYGFANQSWNIDDAPAAYQNRLDLRDSMNIYVDLTAGIDVVKQQAFWLFNSIDPETGLNPWQVDRGMLPVNDSTHVGEGFVTFRLKPQEDLRTGDTLSIVASIVFDQNDTIPTNRWTNTIDAGNPTSKVKARQDSKNEHLYHLTLQAADDEGGCGLRRVLLYQANNFGIYEEVAACPVDTVIDFTAEPGHQYKFYSIAEDNVGNREPLKEQPDLVININAAPTDIALSDTIFQDDIAVGGFIAEMTSEDVEQDGTFTYALAEGDGAIHNDMFQISGTQLQAKECFKCAEDSVYKIRLSTTDEGGLSFSKAFVLNMKKVLIKPKVDTLTVTICEGETCFFHGHEYDKAGIYTYTKSNDFMCDSVYVLELSVVKAIEKPIVTVEGTHTLVSSAAKGNQWFRQDGTPIEGATEQKFTPTEDGIYYVAVTNGSCYSDASRLYRVVLTDKIDLTLNLQEGWNWISSSLNEENMINAKQFIAPINESVNRLVGINAELTNDPQYGLVGQLERLSPSEGYKIKMDKVTTHTWTGTTAKPETTSIKLHKGWNWIGYIPAVGQPLSDAFVELTAVENAVIKCEDDFSTFTDGAWVGTLDELFPGRGYMYYADKEQTFTYPNQRVFVVTDEQNAKQRIDEQVWKSMAPWTYNEHKYQDNTNVIAKLMVNDLETIEGTYIVGAFCGEECRGIGKYVNDRLFITIHGTITDDKRITFKAVETITGEVLSIHETMKFDGKLLGTYRAPFVLNATGITTSAENQSAGYTIYPKPLRNKMYINGETGNIKTVSVLSSGGVIMISENGYDASGIDVSTLAPGVYVVAIVTNDNQAKYEKVLKAK